MILKENVKSLCRMRGISQRQLAEKIGITNSALNISLGKNGNPKLENLIRLANALNVSLPVLLSDDVEQVLAPQIETKEVTYLRCPNCGGKIHLYARGDYEKILK